MRRIGLGLALAFLASGEARADEPLPIAERNPRLELEVDGRLGPIDGARASLTRTAPLGEGGAASDGLRLVHSGGQAPHVVEFVSLDDAGVRLGVARVAFASAACPEGRGAPCAASASLRLVTQPEDSAAFEGGGRSPLVARLGGVLEVREGGRLLGRVRVTAPPDLGLGLERARLRVRVVVVRLAAGGAPPLGEDVASALEVVRGIVTRAGGLWASCGIDVGPEREIAVSVVDPPPAHLVAVGCGHGLPASGGALRLTIEGKSIVAAIPPGTVPRAAARLLARAIEAAGFTALVSDNPRSAASALATSDVLVRTRRGSLVEVAPPPGRGRGVPEQPVSTDPTLDACIGEVDLADGLQHFGDVDAAVGTLEERALVKAFDDGDPGTLDVLVIPGFARGGRIGESFIASDRGSIASTVILDRAGLRPSRAAVTLAHELGHVLLDDPGHPDDFGVDTPTSLMDSDASDPSAFGPRRLGLDECRRAFLQSGPSAPVRMLRPWPAAR